MNTRQFVFFMLLSGFYAAYISRTLSLKRRGIRSNLLVGRLTRGQIVQWAVFAVTLSGVAVQYASVWQIKSEPALWLVGFLLSCLGLYFFVMAILTMRSNWRAGYGAEQNTDLVTGGIYRVSRNPAFVGFDLLYIGCATAYPGVLNIVWAVLAVLLFHLQILGEERFLTERFGRAYVRYWQKVGRYFGRRGG